MITLTSIHHFLFSDARKKSSGVSACIFISSGRDGLVECLTQAHLDDLPIYTKALPTKRLIIV